MSRVQTKKIDLAFFKAMVECMPDAVHVLTTQGNIIYSNPQGAKLFGFRQKEMIGKSLSEFNRLNDAKNKEIISYLLSHLQQNDHWTGTLESIKKDGTSFKTSVKIALLKQGDTQHLICMQQEILDKTKLREQLQKVQMGAMKNARMAALGEMAAGIAHEINNPLAIISGNLHLIQAHADKPEFSSAMVNKYSDKIEKSIQRIQNVIRGMKTFVHRENKPPKVICSACSIIEDTLSLCIEKFRGKGIELEVRLPSEEVQLVCNSAQISQILINLLNNAFDAIEILQEKWVRIDGFTDGRLLRISVTDSGSSIPSTAAKKIFKPFHSSKTIGMGLGLSLSKNFAEEHGGSLILDQSCEHTRFVLTLPAEVPLRSEG